MNPVLKLTFESMFDISIVINYINEWYIQQ